MYNKCVSQWYHMTGYTPLFKFHFVIRWHSDEIPLALHILNNLPIFVEAEGWAQEDLSSRMCGECVSVGDAVCFLHAWGITEEFQLVVKHWDTLLLRYHFHIVIKILSLWGSLFDKCVLSDMAYCSNLIHVTRKLELFIKRSTAMSRSRSL